MGFFIKKVSGQIEPFDEEKLRRSLQRPGASTYIIDKIIKHIKNNLDKFPTTEDIYKYSLDRLIEGNPSIASRYNLKKALLEFGPTGFPFEKYIAEIFKAKGYKIKLNQIVKGWCVDHEIDIIVKKENENSMVECKFHNEQFYETNVKVPLYTNARFHDIEKTWTKDSKEDRLTNTWVFTNTKFTYEAIKYGNCVGMRLTSWNYPHEANLARLIDELGLHPITSLTSLNRNQKKHLMENGLILCKDVQKYSSEIREVHANFDKIINEAERTCRI
jgi:Holliday junction resolvase-like predicted endonuclease